MIYTEVNEMSEDIKNTEEVFEPSPKWKRVFAWILFIIVCIGIVFWLLGIAYPTWIDSVKEWFGNTF